MSIVKQYPVADLAPKLVTIATSVERLDNEGQVCCTRRCLLILTSNADGPRNAASRPVDRIALHTMTELDDKCIHQATAYVDIDIERGWFPLPKTF